MYDRKEMGRYWELQRKDIQVFPGIYCSLQLTSFLIAYSLADIQVYAMGKPTVLI